MLFRYRRVVVSEGELGAKPPGPRQRVPQPLTGLLLELLPIALMLATGAAMVGALAMLHTQHTHAQEEVVFRGNADKLHAVLEDQVATHRTGLELLSLGTASLQWTELPALDIGTMNSSLTALGRLCRQGLKVLPGIVTVSLAKRVKPEERESFEAAFSKLRGHPTHIHPLEGFDVAQPDEYMPIVASVGHGYGPSHPLLLDLLRTPLEPTLRIAQRHSDVACTVWQNLLTCVRPGCPPGAPEQHCGIVKDGYFLLSVSMDRLEQSMLRHIHCRNACYVSLSAGSTMLWIAEPSTSSTTCPAFDTTCSFTNHEERASAPTCPNAPLRFSRVLHIGQLPVQLEMAAPRGSFPAQAIMPPTTLPILVAAMLLVVAVLLAVLYRRRRQWLHSREVMQSQRADERAKMQRRVFREFLHSTSHDMRTPLQAAGSAVLLLSDKLGVEPVESDVELDADSAMREEGAQATATPVANGVAGAHHRLTQATAAALTAAAAWHADQPLDAAVAHATSLVAAPDIVSSQESDSVDEFSSGRLLHVVQSSISFLATLMDNVLDLDKIDAEKVRSNLRRDVVDLRSSLHEVVRMLRCVSSHQHGVPIVEDLRDVPSVVCDRARVMRIVSNLVANALKFTVEGCITVSMQVVTRESQEKRAASEPVRIQQVARALQEQARVSGGGGGSGGSGGGGGGSGSGGRADAGGRRDAAVPSANGNGSGSSRLRISHSSAPGCGTPPSADSYEPRDRDWGEPASLSRSRSHPRSISGDDAQVYVQFAVEDTGRGMTWKQLRKVCEPYVRSSSSVGGGTGLGLYVCRGFVQAYRGSMVLLSTPGRGTRVEITLPLTPAPPDSIPAAAFATPVALPLAGRGSETAALHAQAAELIDARTVVALEPVTAVASTSATAAAATAVPATAASAVPAAAAHSTSAPTVPAAAPLARATSAPQAALPVKVLVVDDTRINLRLLHHILEGMCQFPVKTATNGQIALDLMTTTHFDVVFMDLNMPVMCGCDAVREYRAQERAHPPSFICALTGNAAEEDAREAYEAGCDMFLTKPCSPLQLREVLVVAMRRARG